MEKTTKLPIFGVGPIYVITCLLLTIFGLCLDYFGFLDFAKLPKARAFMSILGGIFIIGGIILWVKSVIFSKISEKIKSGLLVTDGVYSIVRNPIYSAFLFIFTGALLFAYNLCLLVLPFIFWAFLTVLMKNTEEKWLQEKFGDSYTKYCKKVNRIIPWFKR